jgi:transcriptional regulator with XRE-family HTH domain
MNSTRLSMVNRIERERHRLGLSQERAAALVGVTRNTFVRWERALAEDLKYGSVARIAQAFNCPMDQLVRVR